MIAVRILRVHLSMMKHVLILFLVALGVFHSTPGGLVAQEQAPAPVQEDLQQGIELLQQGKVDEALPLLQKAVGKEPTKADGYRALAHAYSKKRMWKEAVETYQ